MTFEVQKGNTTVRSVWTNSVRNALPKQAGWAKLQEVRATAAKHWTERVWYCHNQRWMRSSKEGTEASRSGSFKNGQEWGKKCFEDLDQRRMGRPATRTWSTDFLLREGSSREEIGKWLKNKPILWRRQRRLLLVVTGTFPCGQQMQKYGYRRTATCVVSEGARGALKQLERRAAEGDNRPYSERRVPWTKGGGHSRAHCVHPELLQ